MKDVMGIIYTSKDDINMRELTSSRAVAALPVIGRYRMIDFQLSSLVNSGIRNVGVIVQKNYHSLMDHLGAGKEWDLHTKNDGLFILPPFQTRENIGTYDGTLDALRSNIAYLRRSNQDLIILMGAYSVFNLSFEDMVQQHRESGADVTLMYTTRYRDSRVSPSMLAKHTYLQLDENQNVVDFEIGPNIPENANFCMDVILMRRSMLVHLADQALAHGMKDVLRDMIPQYLKQQLLTVRGYEYKGYHRRIESILSYFEFNMDMLHYDIRRQLFAHPVYTKVRDEVPAKYEEGAHIKNSLVADGCIIEGTVENSVLFRGVRVRAGAVVRNSILMQESEIQEGAQVENVIFDKAVTIRSGRLIGQRAYPVVIGKNMTL
jgi:glucose-1-phosphate adenylyltransferase